MVLPIFKSDDTNLMLMQTKWASQLNPILGNALNGITILPNVVLASGVNVINHKLGKLQTGWIITDINSAVTIYRSSPFNDRTLSLTASGACVISLGVF